MVSCVWHECHSQCCFRGLGWGVLGLAFSLMLVSGSVDQWYCLGLALVLVSTLGI